MQYLRHKSEVGVGREQADASKTYTAIEGKDLRLGVGGGDRSAFTAATINDSRCRHRGAAISPRFR